MALTVETLERQFTYNGMTLPDPNPDLPVGEVQRFHAAQFPELTNAKPTIERKASPGGGFKEFISFSVPVGTKG